jgi:sugar lactone lactonase YvrE
MRLLNSTLSATIVAGLLAGCSGNSATPGAVVPSIRARSTETGLRGLSNQSMFAPISPDTNQNLYVANNLNNTISVYAEGSTSPLRTISDCISSPESLAFDSSQYLYVANKAANDVTVYLPESSTCDNSLTLTRKIKSPVAVAVGPAGKPNVANSGNNSVTVYEPHSTTMYQQIVDGVQNPQALAFDSSGYLYVANGAVGSGKGSVSVYTKAEPKTLLRIITLHVDNPRALAVDSSGNLYVANFGTGVFKGSVKVYKSAASGNTYWYTDSGSDITAPDALGINNHKLFIADTGSPNEIGQRKLQPPPNSLAPISTDVSDPDSLVFHSNGNIVVANYGSPGNVQTFTPSGSPFKTITTDIDGPVSLGLGP